MTPFRQYMDAFCAGDAHRLPSDVVAQLLKEFPFFTMPAVAALKSADVDSEERKRLMAHVALNAPDMESLMLLVDPDGHKFADFYPTEEADATPSTDKAIDTFLDTYGNIDEHEQALLERLIFNPVPDYSQVLVKEAENEPSAPVAVSGQDAMLDAFLASQEKVERHAVPEVVVPAAGEPHLAKPSADSPLSESLAKIYIKKHRYDKAYEIINNLSLNFPEKSIYFADQLRFLRKLMLNQRYSKK